MHAHCRLRQTKLRCGAVTKSTLWPAQIGRLHFWYKICTTIKYVARRTTTTPSGTQLISYVLLGKLVLLFACNYLHISFVAVKKIPRSSCNSTSGIPVTQIMLIPQCLVYTFVVPAVLTVCLSRRTWNILRRKNTASSAPFPHHPLSLHPFWCHLWKKNKETFTGLAKH